MHFFFFILDSQQKSDIPHDKVLVKRLTGGITNVLFQATYYHYPTPADDDALSIATANSTPASTSSATTAVDDDDAPQEFTFLVRAYGNGTDAIIDRDREFATHQHLHTKNLAPQLYARFGNGLVYAYLPGRAVHYTLLSDPHVAVAIARRLAEWHDVLDSKAIETHIAQLKKDTAPFVKTIWGLMEGWIEAMPANVIKTHTKAQMKSELGWIQKEIGALGGPMVVAHCDLLAGNVIIPADWEPSTAKNSELEVSFIDYEYSMKAPRAFDIANHFMEWQGFDCKRELIPSPDAQNPVLLTWARDYLSYFPKYKAAVPPSHDVDELVREVLTWWGMPGFYWGVWSAIQSSISDIEFDYAHYANERLAEYWAWKETYLGGAAAKI